MGRRRAVAMAAAERKPVRCAHPASALRYQRDGHTTRVKCSRCGQELLPLTPRLPDGIA
jgi:hypothetical protein